MNSQNFPVVVGVRLPCGFPYSSMLSELISNVSMGPIEHTWSYWNRSPASTLNVGCFEVDARSDVWLSRPS